MASILCATDKKVWAHVRDAHDAPQAPDGSEISNDPGGSEQIGTSTAVLEREERIESPGDHERYAHYVRKDKAMRSAVEGTPVVALCGKVWIPMRNPDRYPVCPICKEIYQRLGKNGGMNGDQSWPFGSLPPEQ